MRRVVGINLRTYSPAYVWTALAANVLIATTVMMTAPGCHRANNSNALDKVPAASQPFVTERPLPANAQPTLIRQGPLPLVYLSDGEAMLRFVDLTSGTELGRAAIKPRQIVSFDARRGVALDQVVLRAGPLSPDHQYGIYADPDTSDYIRQTHSGPTAADRARAIKNPGGTP